jgi:hypothetical protein
VAIDTAPLPPLPGAKGDLARFLLRRWLAIRTAAW